MNYSIEKFPQNKIDGLNLIEDIKADIVKIFEPILPKLKIKVDGTLDKKSSAIVQPLYEQLKNKYGKNLRIYLDTRSNNYWCFNCDLWVITKVSKYDNPKIEPSYSGDYLRFYVNYDVSKNSLSYDKREKISLEGLHNAQLRHRKYKEQLKDIETLISMVEREFCLDKYSSFI